MKKGICFEYREGLPLKEQFELYRKAGFDGIELPLYKFYPERMLAETARNIERIIQGGE